MSGLKLKLNLNTGVPKAPSQSTPSITTPATTTPGGSKPRLKITNKSTPSTPAPTDHSKPKKTKAGRTQKPSAKVVDSRKRIKEQSDTEAEDDGGTISVQQPAPKKIKLSISGGPKTPAAAAKTPITPVVLKAKVKGKPPPRDPGTGYDSEASDREIDPVIEEQFVLRLLPGDDCEYLRKAIEDKKIGIPRNAGGADISMKFFDLHGRRGAVTIRGHIYAATLVDLPSVSEAMKSWDRRGWWKCADVCQMFWVFAQVQSEEDARTIPLPDEVDRETYQYPHGLTPPMHFARKLRFRKRLHKSTIERVEEEVQRLLAADAKAETTSYEIIDPDADDRRASQFDAESTPGYGHDEDEDAEGEDDDQDQGYFNHHPVSGHEEDMPDDDQLERDLQAAFEEDLEAPTPDIAGTPSVAPAAEPEEDSGDDSFDDDDGDNDGDVGAPDIDEDEKARLAQIEGIKEDIAEFEAKIRRAQFDLSTQKNPILQKRMEDSIRKLKQEVQLKKSSIGEGEENE
ncbi:hypothetical protein EG329_012701 [Mollisiaceae sp. DMI_Dod_QoI]|nr:hypothetical protein EG329_012701 [Helotiales sp. DMI_Dod_QoI]